MKHRIIAILLVLCLCASLVPAAQAAETRSLAASIDIDQLVDHGISMFKALEAGGKWDSVANMTSIGCVGMGIMGWINSSALQLLKWCATSSKGGDPEYARSILGDDLYNEVVSAPVAIASELMPKWGYWGSRLFSAQELAAARTLLGSTVGIRVQKNLARLYITKQAQRASAPRPLCSTTAPPTITTARAASRALCRRSKALWACPAPASSAPCGSSIRARCWPTWILWPTGPRFTTIWSKR